MSEQIKVSYDAVKNSIGTIGSSIDSIQSELLREVGNGNHLQVVNQINEMNHMITNITSQYKELLQANNEIVKKSLDSLQDVDQKLASSTSAMKK